jgi:3-oxoadipate enol-lactonase
MESVVLRGQKIAYGTAGESGPVVLLVMGFGMSGQAWTPQIEGLSGDHRVVWFDNRGIGGSEPSHAPYDLTDLADDSMALLDFLGHASAHVVGVSMGGMTAQQIALRHRSRVKSLTLIATHPGGLSPKKLPTFGGLRLFLRANTSRGEERFAALRELLYPAHFREQLTLDADFSKDSMDSFASPADRKTLLYQLRAVLAHDGTRALKALADLDTLVIRPDMDVLVRPENSDRLHQILPRSTLVAFSRAGHGVTHQEKHAVNAHLRAHFSNADRRH